MAKYNRDQQRVANYVCLEVFNGQIGAGEDPIGFLIAHHRTLLQFRQEQLNKEKEKRDHQHYLHGR